MQSGSTGSLERTPTNVRFAMLAIVILAAFAVPVTSSADTGGGGSSVTPWIALASVDGEPAQSSSDPRLGSRVAFATGYPRKTRNPWVSVLCYQDGTLVYGEGGKPVSSFVLGGAVSDWTAAGGAASCRAELGDLYWRGGQQYYTYLAETWFDPNV